MLTFRAAWRWEDLDRAAFTRLMENHGAWVEANSDADSPAAALHSDLLMMPAQLAGPSMMGQVSVESGAERLKSAYAKKTLSRAQIEAAFSHLSETDPDRVSGVMTLSTYGGRVGDVAPDATAYAHRGTRIKIGYVAVWPSPSEADAFEAGVRNFYRAVYADTGGVPVPNEINDGAYINYPDADLRNPAWNTSDTPWHYLYYKNNYRRLQRVKAQYDPERLPPQPVHRAGLNPSARRRPRAGVRHSGAGARSSRTGSSRSQRRTPSTTRAAATWSEERRVARVPSSSVSVRPGCVK